MRNVIWLGSLAWGAPALACGGFFCDAVQPVDQAGERILFAIDAPNDVTEMHVQVKYAGPSESFSWLLPTPSEPEVLASTEDVFTRLGWPTAPSFVPTQVEVGKCTSGVRGGRGVFLATSDGAVDDTDGGGVSVTARAQVGPYDATTLRADSVDALTAWLAEFGYDLPEGGESKLAAYVAADSYFVALKLSKDRSAGDIVPIALRFQGTEPIIPLQLTAVAAVDDMSIQPFVLSAGRAVPENYLHVVINELAVDWTTAGANYLDVITRAADQAGGQAFATDFAGLVAPLGVHLFEPGALPIEQVRELTNAEAFSRLFEPEFPTVGDTSWQRVDRFPVGTGTVPILARFVEVPANMQGEPAAFFSCIECYADAANIAVDGPGLAAALELEWMAPMARVQALIDKLPWLTRMSSSMSGGEMTVDPRFVVNDDLPATRVGVGEMRFLCNGTHTRNGAPRELVLPDGTSMSLPSLDDAAEMDFQWDQWVSPMAGMDALIIEQAGRSGAPTPVRDRVSDRDAALTVLNRGCGCDSRGGGGAGAALLALASLALRRRVLA